MTHSYNSRRGKYPSIERLDNWDLLNRKIKTLKKHTLKREQIRTELMACFNIPHEIGLSPVMRDCRFMH